MAGALGIGGHAHLDRAEHLSTFGEQLDGQLGRWNDRAPQLLTR